MWMVMNVESHNECGWWALNWNFCNFVKLLFLYEKLTFILIEFGMKSFICYISRKKTKFYSHFFNLFFKVQ